jgi:hypothetical protein
MELAPAPEVASEDPLDAEALAGMRESDKLADAAGINPDVLRAVKEQEWHERK